MNDLVSILIPAYNAERWISDTMLSAINQTWANKEIIVVDDGSTDNTLAVAKRLESETVKVITQRNTGACGARNNALTHAQGDYIQWLDADDLLDPEKISIQLLRKVGSRDSRTLLTAAWGSFFFCQDRARFRPDSLWQDLSPIDWITTKFANNVWMNPTAWLVSRRLTDLAGPWDGRLSLSGDDDGEYICRVVAASEEVRFVPEARCYYRIGNVGSLNWEMGRSDKRLESLLLSLGLSIKHLRAMEDSDRTRRACLKLLETWLPLYYGEKPEFVAQLNDLASQLGGTLGPPRLSWKYYPIELMFGSCLAKQTMNSWRKRKLLLQRNWDRFLSRMPSRRTGLEFAA